MTTQTEALKMALEALDGLYMPNELERVNKAIIAINEALMSFQDGAQQNPQGVSNEQVEPVAYKKARIHWLCQEWKEDHLSDINFVEAILAECLAHPPVSTAQPDCTRSHPHEEMSKECELRTEIARLTSQQAHRSQAQLQLKMTALEKAWFHGYENDIESALRDLREEIINSTLVQPKEPEQEPVAWCVINNGELIEATLYRDYAEEILAGQIEGCGSEIAPLYTHPPVPTQQSCSQRQCNVKPLTDEAAMFAAQHKFLEWNRQQDERLVKVAYEYGVFQKAIELYNEAAHGTRTKT